MPGWLTHPLEMNLDGFLEGGNGFIQEVFMTWTEVMGTARVNEVVAGFMREEGDDLRGNEDMNITIIIRRE